jgi:hypothetical protein
MGGGESGKRLWVLSRPMLEKPLFILRVQNATAFAFLKGGLDG